MTPRRNALRSVVGMVLLLLAVLSLVAARGVRSAERLYVDRQAAWQRAVAPDAVGPPTRDQRLGEWLLGVGARAEAQRVYERYRAGLADVIEGTAYPQTRARFTAVDALTALREDLAPVDRAVVETVIGTILVDGARSAGARKQEELRKAEDSFRRALEADPGNVTAKLDLEVLLQRASSRASRRSRAAAASGRRPKGQEDPKGPVAPVQAEGQGF